MKILISGASGLMGTRLASVLSEAGHTVGRLVRPGGKPAPGNVAWDPTSAKVDTAAMEGTDAFVHLSGASIGDGRWTPARKAILRSSRVDSTRVLVDALARLARKPKVLVCASATGYYGDRSDEILTESSEPGTDFLALLARDWEGEATRAEHAGIRTVRLRYGVVLSGTGGALPRMTTPFKLGIGGRFGSGRQWMSWIAVDDAIEITRLAIMNDAFVGPINVVAPDPVRNADFVRALAKALHRPAIFPAPAFALRLVVGEMADPLLLSSQRVRPERLLSMRYAFRQTDLGTVLRSNLA
ncbi:MAG TPA: TIGR01777 family oxidoreductase [Candidatus Acidoferrum sp.]|nr:TIGR01777 family oxidoreductase [Candidatus Acidoferrum sp.]